MIKIGIIGMGQRGKATLERLGDIPEASVVCVCDRTAANLTYNSPPLYKQWRDVVALSEIELLYICTPWDCHVEIAVEAMKAGKHVAIEVPAAMTIRDCELLVKTSKNTGRHCVMLENCCYDTWHLGVKEMVRKGLLGEITHLEGAYIHKVAENWMINLRRKRHGNPYPTHGLGPMCQLLRKDDCMDYLISLDAPNPTTGENLNDTLIRTHLGVTMLLQYDISTPRPYNRMQTVCGTEGFVQKYPLPCVQLRSSNIMLSGNEATTFVESHISPTYQKMIAEGKKLGVKNVMNYMMDRRLIEAIQNRTKPDTNASEAALWSCIVELTERSAKRNGTRVNIPKF